MDRPVLVLGGSGHYGQQIVAALRSRGAPVRVMSRQPERTRGALGAGLEVVGGDVTEPATVEAALADARAVVIAVSAFSRRAIRRRLAIERDGVLGVLAAARAVGVARVVYLSGYDVQEAFARELGLSKWARPMLDVQRALADSDLDWTVLGCPPSMEIFFAMIRHGTMTVPGGGPPSLPTIAPADLGVIAAQAALRDDLGGRHIRAPGPEALSFPAAAQRIGAVWGRPIGYRPIPLTPIRIAAVVTWPVSPYIRHLTFALKLLNGFPQDLAAQVPADHQRLVETFDLEPTTLEMEARRRLDAAQRRT